MKLFNQLEQIAKLFYFFVLQIRRDILLLILQNNPFKVMFLVFPTSTKIIYNTTKQSSINIFFTY